jgi:UDP-glucuronate 4-epimerase
MAPTIFARAILERKPLKLFNSGKNLRDFTFVDDIVDGVVKVLLYPPADQSGGLEATATTRAAGLVSGKRSEGTNQPLRIFNLGHHRPVETVLFVKMLEQLLGKTAKLEMLPPQPGDMFETCADLTRVQAAIGFTPKVSLEDGLKQFVEWFRGYYRL